MESISFGSRRVPGFALGDPPPTSCPAALPSGSSAAALLSGDMSALPIAVAHTVVRAALVGAGLDVQIDGQLRELRVLGAEELRLDDDEG